MDGRVSSPAPGRFRPPSAAKRVVGAPSFDQPRARSFQQSKIKSNQKRSKQNEHASRSHVTRHTSRPRVSSTQCTAALGTPLRQ
eukprot:scaffold9121_cov124-Isochrysis_galbana.AAC.4